MKMMRRNEGKYVRFIGFVVGLFICLMSGIQAKADYKIAVNRAANCVTVYERMPDGGFGAPVKAFVCSVGRAGHETPPGTYKTSDYYEWRLMVDNSYGHYAVRFNKGILFHSVPYYTQNAANIEWEQYNLLGEPASLGCVRLTWADAKWIYENCARGTEVIVYDDAENPGLLGKPTEMKILPEYPIEFRQWDPTNMDEGNPWNAVRPQLYQKDGYTDGVLRVPVGSTPDYIYNLIGLMESNGYFCNPGEYKLTVNGKYDLSTEGVYNVSLCGVGPVGIRREIPVQILVGQF